MSTTIVSPQSLPAAGWIPNLRGMNLPPQAINGINQSFQLLYSLRDTVNQQSTLTDRKIQYGSHFARVQVQPQAILNGAIWYETDRASVVYQVRLSQNQTTQFWFYAGGIMWDVAANQPSDLGTNDTGFLFLSSDAHHLYHWNGTSWDQVL